MAFASNCDSCGGNLLEDHTKSLILPPVRPPRAYVCSPKCEQVLIKQIFASPNVEIVEKDRYAKFYANAAAEIGYVPSELNAAPTNKPISTVDIPTVSIESPQQENLPIELKLFDKVKSLVTKEGEIATYNLDSIEKEVIKRLDYFGEEVSAADEELKRDASEIHSSILDYLARKGVPRPAELYKGDFQRQWKAALEVEEKSTAFYPNPKGAIKKGTKREYSNAKLGEEIGALIRATSSVDRGTDVAELSFAVRSLARNITKKYKRGLLGLNLLQRLLKFES